MRNNSGDTAAVNFRNYVNSGSGTRTVNLGASTWTCGISSVNTCVWQQTGHTNLTQNANTSTVIMSGPATGLRQVLLGTGTGGNYNTVTIQESPASTSFGTALTGNAPTIATLNIAPGLYVVQNAVNWAITTLNFTGGTPSISNPVFLNSVDNFNSFTFTLSNPATCNFCIIGAMTAATSAITANNSINLGRNTSISFSPPSGGSCPGRIIGGENKFKSPIPSRGPQASVC